MIVVDSSALIAILRREPEADRFLHLIAESEDCLLSSVSLLETSMVLAGRASYALAKERNVPLLFKGGDFLQTDVRTNA